MMIIITDENGRQIQFQIDFSGNIKIHAPHSEYRISRDDGRILRRALEQLG